MKPALEMKMTNWTKGPWEVGRVPTRVEVPGRDGFNNNNYRVADAYSSMQLVNSPRSEEAHANAHLIASAPELYEALDTCIRQLEALTSPLDVPDGALAALAKARGEK